MPNEPIILSSFFEAALPAGHEPPQFFFTATPKFYQTMRSTLFVLCLSCLLCSSFSTEKPGAAEIIVTGLRFDNARTEALKKIPKQPAFVFDNNNVLRPTKDYQIIYVKSDKALVILPKTTTYSSYKQLDGYEEIELPGGILIGCMCDGPVDNCHFDNSNKEHEFVCTGNCRCYIGIAFDLESSPLQYETGGRWFNF